MLNITKQLIFAAIFACAIFVGCKDDSDDKFDVEIPNIQNIIITPSSATTLGSDIQITGSISDNDELQSIAVKLLNSSGSTIGTKRMTTSERSVTIDFIQNIPYTTLTPTGIYKVLVEAIDASGNKASIENDINVTAPVFSSLYLLIEGENGSHEMKKASGNSTIYSVKLTLPAYAKIKIASQSDGAGFVWGQQSGKLMEIGASKYLVLAGEEPMENVEIGFDLSSFLLITDFPVP
jgi:hypothetical protein